MDISIQEIYLEKFKLNVTKHNKKLEVLGISPITYSIKNKRFIKIDKYAETLILDIEVNIPNELEYENWEIIAIREHLPNNLNLIYHINKKIEFNKDWNQLPSICEHCNINRFRKFTYIILEKSTNELKIIGSSCINDYTGHKNFEKSIKSIINSIKSLEGFTYPDDLIKIGSYYRVKFILSLASIIIKKLGWCPSSKGGLTKKAIESFITDPYEFRAKYTKDEINITEEDKDLAIKIIEYINTLDQDSSYISNLKALFSIGRVEKKHFGLIASAVQVYFNSLIKKVEVKSEFFGEKGTRYHDIQLKVHNIKYLTTNQYGYYGIDSYLITFIDENGNIFKWFTSKNNLEINITYKCSFTVKDHSEWNNIKETIINRVKDTTNKK